MHAVAVDDDAGVDMFRADALGVEERHGWALLYLVDEVEVEVGTRGSRWAGAEAEERGSVMLDWPA